MKKIELIILAAEIEFHWYFIRRIRRKGSLLLSGGMPLTSQKLFTLNRRLSVHSTKVLKKQGKYDVLMNLITEM